MAENLPAASAAGPRRFRPRTIISILLFVGLVAGLIGYKAQGGLKRISKLQATGSLGLHPEALHRPPGQELIATGAQTLAYLKIVGPALLFGLLVSAAVHATISPRRLATLLGQGDLKPQLAAAAVGAPLMLCSCCVAPMFPAVYRRSQRLGPSLAFTLAAPALNPAANVLIPTIPCGHCRDAVVHGSGPGRPGLSAGGANCWTRASAHPSGGRLRRNGRRRR